MELIRSLKENTMVKNLFLAFLATLFLAISSKIKIPFWPVPMTMQTFMVMLIGILFGWKLGLFTVSLYLMEGIMGLPVFAGTPEKGMGMVYFTGPTMGYLLGFLVTVYITGFLKFDNNFLKNFVKLCFAVSFIYLFGLFWLGSLIGWDKPIFELGAKPFLLAELFKVLILTILMPKIQRFRI
tara:strand:- start:75 stop:620 length:546 start_codon:yes stop_codon:yes gene_type:complete